MKFSRMFAVALIITWIAMFSSVSRISDEQYEDYYQTYSQGQHDVYYAGTVGFPFTVFRLPPSAMGYDIPPDGSFFPFMLNMSIWFFAVLIVFRLLPNQWFTHRIDAVIYSAAFLVNLLGLLTVLLWFD